MVNNRKFQIVCSSCNKEFDFFKTEWCKFHRWGFNSKLCPHCGNCVCRQNGAWKNWRSIGAELQKYGTKKGIDLKQFIVDGVSVSALWCSIWFVVYLTIGIPLSTILVLMISIVILNLSIGGVQGVWMNWWRRKFL